MSNLSRDLVDIAEKLLKIAILRVLENEGKPLKQAEISQKTGAHNIEHENWITYSILRLLEKEEKVKKLLSEKNASIWEITQKGKE